MKSKRKWTSQAFVLHLRFLVEKSSYLLNIFPCSNGIFFRAEFLPFGQGYLANLPSRISSTFSSLSVCRISVFP